MLASYRRVFTYPGAAAFSLTGLVARLPISMMTLGIVLLVSTLTGSYALAGQVSAAYVVGNASFAVLHGRLADRFGQTRVLHADSVAFVAATTVMLTAVLRDWALPWPHLAAAAAGVSIPQVGAMVRARWAHLLTDPRERHTAFAFEGVADEVVFVTGPALVTFLSTSFAPQTGLLVAVGVGTVGALALAGQRRTAPPPRPAAHVEARPPMPWGLLALLGVGFVALGSLFGALEVATVAFADDAGHKAFSGVMLGAFSFGSLVAGVVTGAVVVRRPALQRARVGLGLLAVGTVLLPFLPGLALMTVALLVTGLALAPTLVALFSLIETSVPPGRLTEAMGLVQTGVSGGIAPGAWVAGLVADQVGGSAAYAVCTVSAVLAALAGFLVRERRVSASARTLADHASPSA